MSKRKRILAIKKRFGLFQYRFVARNTAVWFAGLGAGELSDTGTEGAADAAFCKK